MKILEDLLPLLLFIIFGTITFILPLLRQSKRFKRFAGTRTGTGTKKSGESEEALRLERDRMRENLSRRQKTSPKETLPAASAVQRGSLASAYKDSESDRKAKNIKKIPSDPFPSRISSLSPLKKAVILSEVLGKPKGLEDY